MVEIVVPIAVSVVLPIAIVFIFCFYSNKTATSKINLLSKAIESGVDIDPKVLLEALDKEPKNKTSKSIKSRLVCKLQWGITLSIIGLAGLAMWIIMKPNYIFLVVSIVCLAVGIGLVIAYFAGMKIMTEDMALELKVANAKADADAAEIKAKAAASNMDASAGMEQVEE